MNTFTQPQRFIPVSIDDLIGDAHKVGKILVGKIRQMAKDPDAILKVVLYGPPGVGKSALADIIAAILAGEPLETVRKGSALSVERKSGLDVSIDVVRHWESTLGMGNLFGDWKVKLIQEMDKMPPAAQDRLLEYLDRLRGRQAFIGTSNMQLNQLQERFSTRLAPWKIQGPESDKIAEFMMKRWPDVPPRVAQQIAVGCGGCVRAALIDLECYLDTELAAA